MKLDGLIDIVMINIFMKIFIWFGELGPNPNLSIFQIPTKNDKFL